MANTRRRDGLQGLGGPHEGAWHEGPRRVPLATLRTPDLSVSRPAPRVYPPLPPGPPPPTLGPLPPGPTGPTHTVLRIVLRIFLIAFAVTIAVPVIMFVYAMVTVYLHHQEQRSRELPEPAAPPRSSAVQELGPEELSEERTVSAAIENNRPLVVDGTAISALPDDDAVVPRTPLPTSRPTDLPTRAEPEGLGLTLSL